MPRTIRGDLAGDGLRIAVLVARWNAAVADRLLSGALDALAGAGVAAGDVTVVEVPGAFELPQAAMKVAKSGRVDAVVALGCVVKGETPHHEHIARACAHGLTDTSLATGIPIAFGVITADTPEQAWARSEAPPAAARGAGRRAPVRAEAASAPKGKRLERKTIGHKGIEAAQAAVRLANALRGWERRP